MSLKKEENPILHYEYKLRYHSNYNKFHHSKTFGVVRLLFKIPYFENLQKYCQYFCDMYSENSITCDIKVDRHSYVNIFFFAIIYIFSYIYHSFFFFR